MSLRADPILVFLNNKTGREVSVHLSFEAGIPRIGDGIVANSEKLFRVKDVVWHSYWFERRRINTEIRVYLTPARLGRKG